MSQMGVKLEFRRQIHATALSLITSGYRKLATDNGEPKKPLRTKAILHKRL